MWQWVMDNSAGLGVVVSIGTMVIWVAYFQILLSSYTRQRRTRILINRGAGRGTEARCLISNMGAEPLYVMSILATLSRGDSRMTAAITDLDHHEVDAVSDSREGTNQGPLESGDFMDIGTFSALMARCARACGEDAESLESRFDGFELLIIAAYGADDLSVGARRVFRLCAGDQGKVLDPVGISTDQLRRRGQRRRLERLLEEYR